jgi:hypothetical protein
MSIEWACAKLHADSQRGSDMKDPVSGAAWVVLVTGVVAAILSADVAAQGRVGGEPRGERVGGPPPGGRVGGPPPGGRFGGPPGAAEPAERGLLINEAGATVGYTLFAPLNGTTSYLIDMQGEVVRSFDSDLVPSAWVYFTEDGHVMRGGREPETHGFSGGGQGGRFQTFDLDGELVWDYSLNTAERLPHHDVAILPNGNVLAVVWEARGHDETAAAGRREGFIPADGIWGDVLVELEPDGPNGARVVWEWQAFDHLIQNTDPDKVNYADPAERPERIDINGDTIGTANAPPNPTHDVFHINSVAYNPELDQIIVSAPTFNEIWVIDHSTTTAEAAGSTGGRSGRGGDLLYRWGNPQAYGHGAADGQQLGFQHDAKWIPPNYPGAGNILVFSNRTPGGGFGGTTEVLELVPPVNEDGGYALARDAPFGPAEPVWRYADAAFNAPYISGAERHANGNTLITSGPQGRLFEVDPDGNIVWEYWSPFGPNTEAEGAAAQNPYAVFRAIRIPADHPALAGHGL